MAEIIGLDKIVQYMNQFDFKKIKLSRGSDPVFVRKIKEGETQADLVDAFVQWVDDFVTPGNFKEYKLELLGSYSEDPNARLSPVVKVAVAFSGKETTATPGANVGMPKHPTPLSPDISIEKYVALATENAKLEAQLERLEEKMDELLSDDEDDDDAEVGSPKTLGEAVNQALIGKLDTIVDVVLGYLTSQNMGTQHRGIAGIQDKHETINGISEFELTMMEFKKIHPEIEDDIIRLYHLKKRNGQLFDMLVKQLRGMIDG
jgi:hypothetical protein